MPAGSTPAGGCTHCWGQAPSACRGVQGHACLGYVQALGVQVWPLGLPGCEPSAPAPPVAAWAGPAQHPGTEQGTRGPSDTAESGLGIALLDCQSRSASSERVGTCASLCVCASVPVWYTGLFPLRGCCRPAPSAALRGRRRQRSAGGISLRSRTPAAQPGTGRGRRATGRARRSPPAQHGW